MTMLSLIVNLRPPTAQLALIGQEIALEYAQATFVPVVSQHIPGAANVLADQLSRHAQPGHPTTTPQRLREARCRDVPLRDKTYYATLAEPNEPEKRVNKGSLCSSGNV